MSNLSNDEIKDQIRILEETCLPGESSYFDLACLRELLAYREAAKKPVVIVEESDYLTVAQMAGKEPRRKAVRELYEGALIIGSKLYAAPSNHSEDTLDMVNSPVIPDGWALVPIEPTENMIVEGYESELDETFSEEKEWEAYQAMSGCEQAAHRARLCWAAMLAAAPKPPAQIGPVVKK